MTLIMSPLKTVARDPKVIPYKPESGTSDLPRVVSCQGRCESGCVEPAACRYFALFERDPNRQSTYARRHRHGLEEFLRTEVEAP